MYPDTDSAPIPIDDDRIDGLKENLPTAVDQSLTRLREWGVPPDTYHYLLKRNLLWIIQKIIDDFDQPARFVGTLMGHTLRHIETRTVPAAEFSYYTMYGLFKFIHSRGLEKTIAKNMLPELYAHPKMVFESVLTTIGYSEISKADILSNIPALRKKFAEIRKSSDARAERDWIMGHLRYLALGNIPLNELSDCIEEEIGHD
jgi:glutamyl-tRNA(Gln) amidotransferase subunit E